MNKKDWIAGIFATLLVVFALCCVIETVLPSTESVAWGDMGGYAGDTSYGDGGSSSDDYSGGYGGYDSYDYNNDYYDSYSPSWRNEDASYYVNRPSSDYDASDEEEIAAFLLVVAVVALFFIMNYPTAEASGVSCFNARCQFST